MNEISSANCMVSAFSCHSPFSKLVLNFKVKLGHAFFEPNVSNAHFNSFIVSRRIQFPYVDKIFDLNDESFFKNSIRLLLNTKKYYF